MKSNFFSSIFLFYSVCSTYNGPYIESGNDEIGSSLKKSSSLRSNSHVRWSEEKSKDLNPTILTESPSAHRRPPPPLPNTSLSHLIQSAIIPAGSTISGISVNQFFTPSKEFTSTSFPYV